MAQQYNARNPSIKRILKEYEDFEREKPLGIAVQFNQVFYLPVHLFTI